ncbi:MAG: glycoside hydrolase family 2 TIM barrel-domain containing protein [Niameybacter sp.]|uniref:glycoside hydrolase family 2 protein n=1 Tax=Niameybacter sp. TaxID=2033640 RepID=UPI002FC626FB
MTRIIEKLNNDWSFQLGDGNIQAKKVHLPHTVDLTPAISSGGVNYQGTCTYYKEMMMSEVLQDKKVILEFDGAMGVSKLFVNGQLAREHYCGYTPLVQDVTELLKWGVMNEIRVELDNSDNEDVPPGKPQHALDFTYDGGLYREARMHIVDPLHITHALLAEEVAGGGIFVSYKEVTKESAIVHIKTHVKNEYREAKTFTLTQQIVDAQQVCVGTSTQEVTLQGGEAQHFECDIQVDRPQLWSPETPYLYQVITQLNEAGKVYDEVTTTIGIRTFQFTYDQGILFNEEPRRLSGANYHASHVYIGNALPESVLRRDALKLRQAGFKNIRSHYPFAPGFVQACNEYGLTLIVSAPGWQWFKEGIFAERAKENVKDMVRWQRNNPAIIIWEPMLNESYMSESFKVDLHNIVHAEYPYNDCYTASDNGPTDILYKEFDENMLDPEGEEYVQGDVEHAPVWVREYNDRPDDWDNQSCAWRVPRGWGEEGMLRAVDRALGLDPQSRRQNYINMVNDNKICGYGIWPGIEHNRGYQVTPCWGGTLDLYRVPKFTYYFFQSQQDIEEAGVVLFIANYWSEISSDDVTVYSNAERVRLYHNDELVEEIGADDLAVKHPPFTFKNIRTRCKQRERSIIKVEALVGGEVVATQVRKSPGVQRSLQLEADFMDIPLRADGSDLVMVYCKVVDDVGNVVPMTADKYPIRFSVEGEGEIVGDDSIGANPICPEGGIAAVFVRATTTAGTIKVKAQMHWKQNAPSGVKPAELVFESVVK